MLITCIVELELLVNFFDKILNLQNCLEILNVSFPNSLIKRIPNH